MQGQAIDGKNRLCLMSVSSRSLQERLPKLIQDKLHPLRKLTVAQRVQQATSMIRAAEQVGAYRLRQREPELSEQEAYYIIRSGTLLSREIRKRANQSS